VPFSLVHAGERAGFISVPQFIFVLESPRKTFRGRETSNNPLAVELERENDPAREIFLSGFSDLLPLRRRLDVNGEDLFKCSTR
jgi:hypothetical protein